nr:MAG TPA: hypothetical protein [Caudoviricetes sp.]
MLRGLWYSFRALSALIVRLNRESLMKASAD